MLVICLKKCVCVQDMGKVDEWMSFELSLWCLFYNYIPLAVGFGSSEESDRWNLWIKHLQCVNRLLVFA